MRLDSRCLAAPVSTWTCQGWVLVPDGAREATRRMASTMSRGTGVGRNARMDRRLVMAPSTAAVSASLGTPDRFTGSPVLLHMDLPRLLFGMQREDRKS